MEYVAENDVKEHGQAAGESSGTIKGKKQLTAPIVKIPQHRRTSPQTDSLDSGLKDWGWD
jgi:hypothetical protein